jgi:hypothetical protein
LSYLRFTPAEFQHISRVVQTIELSEDFFPVFKYFLVESLIEIAPELAGRLAQLNRAKLILLYNFLRERRKAARSNRPRRD